MRSGRVLLAAALALLLLQGCAPVAVTPTGASVPPAPVGTVQAPVPQRTEARLEPVAVVRDSTPSADAERVLAGIPEPLSPSQQVPPLRARRAVTAAAPSAAYDTLRTAGTVTMAAPEAAYDTLSIRRTSDNDTSAVPVPSPTQPLGNGPDAGLSMPDSLAAAPTGAPAGAPPAAAPVTSPATPTSGTPAAPAQGPCWRLQVAAPDEQAKAESRRAAAQSLLLVPMAVTFEKGLFKVRTHACMTREAAEALKRRALDSGFDGAFVLDRDAVVAPATGKPRPHPAPARHSARAKPRRR